jgi:hypothetical protein
MTHQRVRAWVLGSCAAPAVLVLAAVAGMVFQEGFGALPMALFLHGLFGFLVLTVSMAAFSPVLLLPLERKTLSIRARTGVVTVSLIVGVAFMGSVLVGPPVVSILLGVLLDALVFLLIVAGPHVADPRQAPHPSA